MTLNFLLDLGADESKPYILQRALNDEWWLLKSVKCTMDLDRSSCSGFVTIQRKKIVTNRVITDIYKQLYNSFNETFYILQT